ncbi:MAG: hypothetical protein KAR54_01120 [Candidatus Pacebacteria bacterium]|nr:hypothetical protein [Candidatus Paceibacterota bacterium]
MFYCLHGDDIENSRKKLHSLLGLLFSKKPDAGFFKIDIDNFSEGKLDELLLGQGLFEKKYIVQLDALFEDKGSTLFLQKRLEDIKESENIFIFIEQKINKPILKKLEKYATKIQEFSLKKQIGRKFVTENENFNIKDFNIFDIADAFGNRKKKDLWVLYQKTRMRNIPPEEVSGILFWQLKSMFQSQNTDNATKAGLKPFVFNKSKRFLKNYSKDELLKISSNLVSIYHNARRGKSEFDISLEMFIISL